ncbi:hypothetical protein CERZMDRAFT_43657 [Cercospora zeae-maydis SCOH1-5]|uniref:Anaphase-promoting complex subunit 4 WD40 domain-containing protein n=1 Tax=Cercospora zeae-maydis SCOH1-5 TaxID=717836 RepID=A0A6A6FD59_9PEZI|nr:hypothetical protein CERZMDRAFT_43657 [Cercospora zeae-maydis SCOH1-5]
MALLNSIHSLTLDLPPSCIQFCPTRPDIFVIGTYFLHRNDAAQDSSSQETSDDASSAGRAAALTQKRTGSLILYEISHDKTITERSSLATDFAILDVQWAPYPERVGGSSGGSSKNDDGPLLAVATSTGSLAFYRLEETRPTIPAAADTGAAAARQQSQTALVLSCVRQVTEDTILVLSLTWHPFRPNVLGMTLSDGKVVLCTSEHAEADSAAVVACWDRNAVISMHDVHEHELEAWIMNFTRGSDTKLLSGGDDMMLQCSQQVGSLQNDSAKHESEKGFEILWQDRKLHQAGVTAILLLTDTLIVTGSYDDHIRLLSLPAIGRRKVLAELNLGGGVWRLKLLTPSSSPALSTTINKSNTFILLCSCMHAGTRVVRLQRNAEKASATDAEKFTAVADEGDDHDWTFSIIARFEEHQSMNYGSDVQPNRSSSSISSKVGGKQTIISTSFYDRLLCLWEVDLMTRNLGDQR